MKYIKILILISLAGTTNVYAQYVPFPKYTEAVEHFFNTPSLSNYKEPTIEFQKKPSGWLAKISDEKQDTLLKIWDSAQQQYSDTIASQDTSSSFIAIRKKYLDAWEKIHFDACPYLGYKDWDKDVIKEYSDYDGDSAELVYGIGRAFSLYADNLLSNKSGMSDSTRLFSLKSMADKLSKDQLEFYWKYRHNAIAHYKKAARLKPSYKTLVGEINLKLDFEYVTSYLDLIQYSTKEEAI